MRMILKIGVGLSATAILLGACSSDELAKTDLANKPTIVVTYSVLGDIVHQLVGDLATVIVVIPDGQDPHEFQPSAKDVETLNNASIVISNGLDFEEGLLSPLATAVNAGIPEFRLGDNVTTRMLDGGADPHLWLSPAKFLEAIPALTAAIEQATGLDLADQSVALTTQLTEIDAQVASTLSGITCKLVSGHDEMGYFADRYGCTVIGAIIPSLSTTSEASAGELAKLKDQIAQHNVKAIFTGLGTPQEVANQLANETGVAAVSLSTHYLNGATNYREFMLHLAQQIADALQ
ncbi:MAG: zinc ABC transporter substrate-binding protein [Actinobacteria bacterium]|nr:MAG: zinc ABC transporter substrate-binding protein [Actinomycetota bacterium]